MLNYCINAPFRHPVVKIGSISDGGSGGGGNVRCVKNRGGLIEYTIFPPVVNDMMIPGAISLL